MRLSVNKDGRWDGFICKPEPVCSISVYTVCDLPTGLLQLAFSPSHSDSQFLCCACLVCTLCAGYYLESKIVLYACICLHASSYSGDSHVGNKLMHANTSSTVLHLHSPGPAVSFSNLATPARVTHRSCGLICKLPTHCWWITEVSFILAEIVLVHVKLLLNTVCVITN